MPLVPSSVKRAVDASGTNILTFLAGLKEVQGIVPVDGNGDPIVVANQATLESVLAAINLLIDELELKANLTDVQPVSLDSAPLPADAATQTTLAALLSELQVKADLAETQPVSAASLPLPAGAATEASVSQFAACDVDEASATVTYVGSENKIGDWLVTKIDTTAGTVIRYAGFLNNGGYLTLAAAWVDRATLSYGTYGVAL